MIDFSDGIHTDDEKAAYRRAIHENKVVLNMGNPRSYKLHSTSCRSVYGRKNDWNPKIVFSSLREAKEWLAKQSVPVTECGYNCLDKG